MAYLLGADGEYLKGADGYYLTDGNTETLFPDTIVASGEISTLDLEDTVLSQYANSPVILSLIQSFQDAIDPSEQIDNWYNDVWNIDTAQGYGLDVWGRIVNVSRYITLPPPGCFGWQEGAGETFGQGPFYSSLIGTLNYRLPDEAYRVLILVKAFSNISQVTAPNLNRMLQALFAGRGKCFCVDLGHMSMMLTFEFQLTQIESAILSQSRAIPRPAGVGVWTYQIDPAGRFGWSEAGAATFGQGTFFGDPQYAS